MSHQKKKKRKTEPKTHAAPRMSNKVVLIFESVMKSYSATIQMKPIEQYFSVVAFLML